MSEPRSYDPRTPPDDPWGALAALRREAAVAHFEPLGPDDPGIDVVLRHEACRQAFLDAAGLSSRYHVKPDGDYSIVSSDPPEHTRQRKILNRTFPPERVASLEPRITQITDELIDGFPAAGPLEFMSTFAFQLPIIVLAELLGVPEIDRSQFKEWSDEQLSQSLSGGTSDEAREFKQWALEQIRARRTAVEPTDDLISALALAEDDDGRLDEWEAASTLVLLVVAGHETTTNALGNAARHLFGDPDARERVAADHDLIPSVVEETLRFDPPVTALPRRATCPVHLDDSDIEEGRIALLHMGAANRDPEVFDDPDELDVARYMPDRPRHGHFAFGYGPHLCIGAPLARAEIRIALERLFDRLPGLHVVPDQDIEQVPAYVFRGPQRLLLDYDRKGQPVTFDLISVDDHILEPPHVWSDRLPEKFREAGPHVETNDDGTEQWVYEGRRLATVGLFATAGKKAEEFSTDPITFADMREGCYDPVARAADMDADGIRAGLNFPTFPRTCGQTFLEADDRELAELCVRAWNDFILDEWCAAAPGRFIPQVIGMLWDPEMFAAELRRCAGKGARAVSFSENPAKLGLPSFHSPHWDPVWRACEETGIVVCLHIGSSSVIPKTADDAPFSVTVALSPMNAQSACSDLILSRVPQEFPNIRISMSEGGIGWVPFALEHCDYVWEKHKFHTGTTGAIRPSEAFERNIWVCFIDEDFGLRSRHDVGVEKIMWESDYPHSDTSWPHSQERLAKTLAGVPDDEVALITHGNAEKLFGLT